MTTPVDLENLVPEAVQNDKLLEISKLANTQYLLEKAIEEAEALIAEEKKKLHQLSFVTIPAAMQAVGLSELKSDKSGFVLKVQPFYSAKIDEKNVEKAHGWLVENKHGAMIKHTVQLDFDKDSTEDVERLTELLEKEGFEFVTEEKVHSRTLTAFVKEQVEAGNPFPLETFNGFVGQKSVIKKA